MINKKLIKIIATALFSAITCVLSVISIPTTFGVPITLQTYIIALCGFFLGAKYGTISVLIYLALGAVGLPVFAGMNGGLSAFIGTTGGFLIGFLPLSFSCGIVKNGRKLLSIGSGFAGLIVCHLLGIVWYCYLGGLSFINSFLLVSAPFLIKDIISIFLAYGSALGIKKMLKSNPSFTNLV